MRDLFIALITAASVMSIASGHALAGKKITDPVCDAGNIIQFDGTNWVCADDPQLAVDDVHWVGEIRLSAARSSSVPDGWLPCDGTEVLITDYPELFSHLGTKFGGDGRVIFGLPDLVPPVDCNSSLPCMEYVIYAGR